LHFYCENYPKAYNKKKTWVVNQVVTFRL